MHNQTYSWMKALTLLLILFRTTITVRDENLTIEDILADINLTDEQLMEKLNARHQYLFDKKLNVDEGIVQFMVDFKDFETNVESIVDRQMDVKDVEKQINLILNKHKDSIANSDLEEAYKEIDPIVKRFILSKMIVNQEDVNLSELEINFEAILNNNYMVIKSKLKEAFDLAKRDIGDDLNSINSFYSTDLSIVIDKSIHFVIMKVITDDHLTQEVAEQELEKVKLYYKILVSIYKNANQMNVLYDETANAIINAIVEVRGSQNILKKQFLLNILNDIFEVYTQKDYHTLKNKYYIFETLIKGLFKVKDSKPYFTLKLSDFSTFIERNLANYKIDMNLLENEQTRDIHLVKLSDFLNTVITHANSYDQDIDYSIVDRYIDDSEFDKFTKIVKYYLDTPEKLNIMWSYQLTALADQHFNKDAATFNEMNLYYDLWSIFRSKSYNDIKVKTKNQLFDEYLDDLYKNPSKQDDLVKSIDLNKNYAYFKIFLASLAEDVEIKLNLLSNQDADHFTQQIKDKECLVRKFLVCYGSIYFEKEIKENQTLNPIDYILKNIQRIVFENSTSDQCRNIYGNRSVDIQETTQEDLENLNQENANRDI